MAKIELGEIAVDVVKKDIKNVHLSVYPPTGKVRHARLRTPRLLQTLARLFLDNG